MKRHTRRGKRGRFICARVSRRPEPLDRMLVKLFPPSVFVVGGLLSPAEATTR